MAGDLGILFGQPRYTQLYYIISKLVQAKSSLLCNRKYKRIDKKLSPFTSVQCATSLSLLWEQLFLYSSQCAKHLELSKIEGKPPLCAAGLV